MNSLRPQRGPMLLIGSLLLGLVCVGAGSNAKATPTIYFLSTGQTGAQTQIDAFHSTTWAFTATSDWELGGGNFTMKDGSSTTDDVMLTVYEGVDSTGLQVAQIDLTLTSFCTFHGGNCQSFNATPFHFVDGSNDPAPLSIANGQSYFVALTSTAPDAQSMAYFIKGLDTSAFLDGNGDPLTGQTLSVPTDVGEPTTLAMLATCLTGLSISRKRRAKH